MNEKIKKSLSNNTVGRILNRHAMKAFSPRKVPLISDANKCRRKELARTFLTKPLAFWDRVIWSDETKINLIWSDETKINLICSDIIKKAHKEITGHRGIITTHYEIQRYYYWPKITESIGNYINNCTQCIINDQKTNGGAKFIKSSYPLEIVGIDLLMKDQKDLSLHLLIIILG